MDKQQQIEEMAKVIDDRLIEARGWLGSMNRGKGYWIAQKLVEHYQPKLPEDSVILSREEYERLLKTAQGKIGNMKSTDFLKACISSGVMVEAVSTEEQVKQAYKKGCKETAEKFLQLAYDRCLEKSFIKKVEELAKQYGVEIKE